MPAPVDHDARRNEVARIASQLIGEQGPDAVTVRDIAKAAGYSTAIVSYYFRTKRELLLFMSKAASDRTVERVNEAISAGESALNCLEQLLPIGEEQQADWNVWLAFWGKAITDEEFRKEQERRGREALELVQRVLSRESNIEPEGEAITLRARTLLTIIVGLATQAVFDPEDWTAKRQREVLKSAIVNQSGSQ